MKNLIIILITIFCLQVPGAIAQSKKVVKKVNTESPVKKKVTTPTKKVTVAPAKTTVVLQPVQKPVEPAAVTYSAAPQAKTTKIPLVESSRYRAALGLKFIYGISLTGKLFLKEHAALEGILRYNGAGGLGTNVAFSGLYEYHNDITSIEGVRWYLGGGGHVNYFSWEEDYGDPVTTFGVAGIIGLEYKFKDLPIAISADWQPGYIVSNGVGFSAENGGIGIKYIFK
jgi:hypothetical protein